MIISLTCFFYLMWISINRIRYSFLFCILHFLFHWSLFFCSFFFFISPFISFVFQGQSMESLHSPYVWQNYNNEKKTNQTEREGWFFWCVRVWEREEQSIPLWCLDEAFQNSKWESVSVIHSDIICRHLQTMQNQEARRKLLTWLTISRSEFVGLFKKCLSIFFQDYPVNYFCCNLIIFSFPSFKEIKEPDVV